MPISATSATVAGTWTLGDLTVNRMGLGSMRLTVSSDTERALAVLHRAVELGVDHFDTAAFYVSPGGILEGEPGPVRYATELIREALAPYGGLVITTKVGPGVTEDGTFWQARTGDQLRAQVEENLRQLGRDQLDVVNLRIMQKAGQDSVATRFEALARMREEKLIRHLGLSNVRIDHLAEAQTIAPVVCVQNSYALENQQDAELLRVCGARGIAFVPFFTMAGARRGEGASADPAPAVTQVARAHGVTEQQVRLAWTLHQGNHVLAIPGTGDPEHVYENVAAGCLRLSEEELALLT